VFSYPDKTTDAQIHTSSSSLISTFNAPKVVNLVATCFTISCTKKLTNARLFQSKLVYRQLVVPAMPLLQWELSITHFFHFFSSFPSTRHSLQSFGITSFDCIVMIFVDIEKKTKNNYNKKCYNPTDSNSLHYH